MTLALTPSPERLGVGITLGVGELPLTQCVCDLAVLTGGSGYTGTPTVQFSGGGGSAAAATAYVLNGVVADLFLTAQGSGYTSTPACYLSGGGGSGCSVAVFTCLGPPTSYVNFSKIENLTPPKVQRERVEVTSHDAVNKKKKYIPAFDGQSDPTLSCLYQKACSTQLFQMEHSGITYGWVITYNDGTTLAFNAFLADMGEESPVKESMKADLTLAIDDSTVFRTQGSG